MLCVILASRICKRFEEGGKPFTALDLKLMTGIPIRITTDLLYELVRVGLLTEITSDDKDDYKFISRLCQHRV